MPYQSFTKTEIDGVFVIQPKLFGDERGWYCPNFELSEFEANTGVSFNFVQKATSFNANKGVLRGLHYQLPSAQGKLVEVISGTVQDVAVDLRRSSPTFGKVVSVTLAASNHNQLWIPVGCAHGYLALEDNTSFTYLVTEGAYTPEAEHGLNPFDPTLNLSWLLPRDQMNLKDRDLSWPNLADIPKEYLF